jgi:hypothetical protein
MNVVKLAGLVSLLAASLGLQSTTAPSENPVAELKQLAWISGAWVSEKDGTRTEEFWTPVRGGLMMGAARTIKGDRAVFFEHLRIEQHKDGLVYQGMPLGRPATPFKMVQITDGRVVFENPKHDYPTRIVYWKDGEGLAAKVEGMQNGKLVSEEWHFKRMGG